MINYLKYTVIVLLIILIIVLLSNFLQDPFKNNVSNFGNMDTNLEINTSCDNLSIVNTKGKPNIPSYQNAPYAMCNKKLENFFDITIPNESYYKNLKKYQVHNDLYSGTAAFDITNLPSKNFEKIINERLNEHDNDEICIFIGKSPLSFVPETKNISSDTFEMYHTGLYLIPKSKCGDFSILNYEHLICTLELWVIGAIFNGISIDIKNNKYKYDLKFQCLSQVPYLFGADNNTYFLMDKKDIVNENHKGYNTHLEYLLTVKKEHIFKLRNHLNNWKVPNNNYILQSFLKDVDCVTGFDLDLRPRNWDYFFCRICDTFCMESIKYLSALNGVDLRYNYDQFISNINFNDVQFIYERVTLIDDENFMKYKPEIEFQNKIIQEASESFKQKHKIDIKKIIHTHHHGIFYLFMKYLLDNKFLKSPIIYLTCNYNNEARLGRFELTSPYLKIIYNKCSFNEYLRIQ